MSKLGEFETIIAQVKAEWLGMSSSPLNKFFMYAHVVDTSKLRVLVTDFKFNIWAVTKSVIQLESVRDMIGIAGPWYEFVDYLVTSLKSENVKIVFEGQSEGEGPAYAKLTAHKSREFPLLTLPLNKLVGVAATEAIGDFSQELFKEYKSNRELLAREQTGRYQLTETVAAEQEKSTMLQKELDLLRGSKRQKSHHINEKGTTKSMPLSSLQESPAVDKKAGSTKATNRVIPAYRRAKVHGILLQDTDDDADM